MAYLTMKYKNYQSLKIFFNQKWKKKLCSWNCLPISSIKRLLKFIALIHDIHNVHTLYTHLTIVAINYLFYQGKLNKTNFYKLDNYD